MKEGYLNFWAILMAFLLLPLFLPAQKNVTILYTNDIESVYEPIDAFWNDSIELIGGLPYLASLIDEVRSEEELSFLFDSGDIFTGALSAATEGKLPFDVYSSMSYDALCLGNHEFEYGWEQLLHVKQRASFPVLNCNIFYENTDIHFAQSYTIVEKEGVRIGLIGSMGIDAFLYTMNPAHRKGLEVRDPLPIIQGIIDEIRNEVDLLILLTHQNQTAPMQTDKEADEEVQRGFEEDYEMAGKLKGVDIIFGGHSDNGLWDPVIHPTTGTMVCMTFGQGKYLGYLNLTLGKNTFQVNESKLIPVDVSQLQPNEKISQLVEAVRTENSELTKVIAKIDQPGYRKYYRESTIGNLMADIMREIAKADIGLVNSGSIRADLNKGDITAEELSNIYPFIDKYHVVEINGVALKQLLEYSYSLKYGLAQLSGIQCTYDSKKPIGQRLLKARVKGRMIKDHKKYTVVSSSFVANGGDGYEMLKNGKLIAVSELNLIECFEQYLSSKRTLAMPSLGRQVDISY